MTSRYHILDTLARLLPAPSRKRAASSVTVVYSPNHLGDILHTAPLLRALRRLRPGARTAWLVGPWSEALARRYAEYADDIIPFAPDRTSAHRGQDRHRQSALAQWRIGLALRRHAPDLLVTTTQESPETRYLANILAPSLWLGVGDRPPPRLRPGIQARFVPYRKDRYQALSLLDLLRPLGIDPAPADAALFFPLTDPDRAAAARFLDAEGIPPDHPLVLISPGSGWPGKNWPLDRYLAVATTLLRDNLAHVAWLGTAAEAAAFRNASAAPSLPLPGHDWMGRLDIPTLAAVMARATLWLGNDSGPMHLAAAVGCPTLSLWGPTEPAKWAPPSPPHLHIRARPRCPGCTYWDPACTCLRPTHECMDAIPVPQVLSALLPVLAPAR